MKAILATGAAVAALTAMSMPASAECINGYETLGNNVVVICEAGPTEFGAFADDGMIPEDQLVEGEEPLFTGSVAPAEVPDDTFVEAPISTAAVATEEFVEEPIEAAAVATEELAEAPTEAAAVATEELVEEPIATATFGEPMLAASAAAEENEVPGQIPDEPFVATEVVIATSIDECRPGQFWMSDEVPIACPQQ